METKIQKWGNSLGVRLPKSVTSSTSLKAGTRVSVSEDKGKVTIEILPDADSTLDEMLASITDENVHAELSWGDAKGKEVW